MALFTNQATLTYNNGVTVNSNIATGNLVEPLTAAKTSLQTTYRSGDNVTYVINLVNSGATEMSNLTVTDNLGAYTVTGGTATVYPLTYEPDSARYFVNGVQQEGLAVTAGPPLAFTGISVPAGGNAVIVYSANVNNRAQLFNGAVVNNTATVTGTGVTDVAANVAVAAQAGQNLNIFKTITPETVMENGTVTYTFTIQNFGNVEADAAANEV